MGGHPEGAALGCSTQDRLRSMHTEKNPSNLYSPSGFKSILKMD